MDDLKLSHVNQKVLDAFVYKLKSLFGKEDELSENTGDVHEYLGVTIDWSLPGKVAFTMFDYLEDIIVEAPEELKPNKCMHPCNGNLFMVKEDSPLLDPKKADLFHRLVARLLFASKRARPDIQVTVAFLCTRVKAPTEEDYRKLGRLIGYVKKTIDLPLILGLDGSETLTWNVDASFATHADAKSHTGASLTLGQGSVISMSKKQKLVTRSSTESELVGLDDALTFIMWAKYFFEEQAKELPENSVLKNLGKRVTIEQDNTSAIQLERNGKRSSTKRTRHIHVRYFYITDTLKNNEGMSVIYRPTIEMSSDFHTKGLQGHLFLKHRNTLMGEDPKGKMFYEKYKSSKKN